MKMPLQFESQVCALAIRGEAESSLRLRRQISRSELPICKNPSNWTRFGLGRSLIAGSLIFGLLLSCCCRMYLPLVDRQSAYVSAGRCLL
jgi:hypothetical protein